MIWIFMKTLKNTIQIKSAEYWLYLMTWLLICLVIKKQLNLIVNELFIRGIKLNISLFRLNSTHYVIMKIPNRQKLQQMAFNHSSDIDFQDFMDLYKNVLQNHILS